MIITKSKPPQRRFAEEPSDNPLWQIIHRVGDKYYPSIRKLMMETWEKWRDRLDVSRLFDGLLGGNTAVVLSTIEQAWMSAENEMLQAAQPMISNMVEEAYKSTMPDVMEGMFTTGVRREIRDWVVQHTGEWITQIGETERQAIRNVVLDALQRGQGPAAAARDIRQYVGLTRPQANAIANLRDTMTQAGIRAERIDTAIDRRVQRMIRQRAMVIARNESMLASKQGNRMAYLDSARNGVIDANGLRRFWVVTPQDACRICRPIPGMNPEGVGINEPFKTPVGNLLLAHAHIQCRCVETIRL